MLDRRPGEDPRYPRSSTASESRFLCSSRIWPGDEEAKVYGVAVHAHCYERDVKPDLEPDSAADVPDEPEL